MSQHTQFLARKYFGQEARVYMITGNPTRSRTWIFATRGFKPRISPDGVAAIASTPEMARLMVNTYEANCA